MRTVGSPLSVGSAGGLPGSPLPGVLPAQNLATTFTSAGANAAASGAASTSFASRDLVTAARSASASPDLASAGPFGPPNSHHLPSTLRSLAVCPATSRSMASVVVRAVAGSRSRFRSGDGLATVALSPSSRSKATLNTAGSASNLAYTRVGTCGLPSFSTTLPSSSTSGGGSLPASSTRTRFGSASARPYCARSPGLSR